MTAGRADRLSRAMIWWHPRRWRQRYGEEILDFLDQHDASGRTVLNLAASALTTRMDPAFWAWRQRGTRRGERTTNLAVGGATIGVLALLTAASILPWPGHEDTWQLSAAGGVSSVAFFPGQRLLVSASGSAGQDSQDTVWDIANPARPVRLAAFQGGQPTAVSPDGRTLSTVTYGGQLALWDVARPGKPARIATAAPGDGNPMWGQAFSPDGRTLAAAFGDKICLWDVASPAHPRLLAELAIPVQSIPPGELGLPEGSFTAQDIEFSPDGRLLASVTGAGGITVWKVSDPARPARAAVLAAPRDFIQAIAFSPRGHLLAGVTYHGAVLAYSLADPARPVRAAAADGILARAFFPSGRLTPAGPRCDVCGPASYAVGFAPDGRTLTVVVDRAENNPSQDNAARDTVFTWTVTESGALGALATAFRNVKDSQPTLAPDGRTVVDGSPESGAVHLWAPAGASSAYLTSSRLARSLTTNGQDHPHRQRSYFAVPDVQWQSFTHPERKTQCAS